MRGNWPIYSTLLEAGSPVSTGPCVDFSTGAAKITIIPQILRSFNLLRYSYVPEMESSIRKT